MSDQIIDQPDGATPLDDVSGLLQADIHTRAQLDAAETVSISNAVDWVDNGRIDDVFTVKFLKELHRRMYNDVWSWAGEWRKTQNNIGPVANLVPSELGRVAMEFASAWNKHDGCTLSFLARFHHQLVWIHPFENGNGRWSRLACDAVLIRNCKQSPLTWATDTLNRDSDERSAYIAALRSADGGDIQTLTQYLVERNTTRRVS